jgi:hypothetical protein
MTLTVAEGTKMSLLLNSGYFKIVPFFMTIEQFIALTYPNLRDPAALLS